MYQERTSIRFFVAAWPYHYLVFHYESCLLCPFFPQPLLHQVPLGDFSSPHVCVCVWPRAHKANSLLPLVLWPGGHRRAPTSLPRTKYCVVVLGLELQIAKNEISGRALILGGEELLPQLGKLLPGNLLLSLQFMSRVPVGKSFDKDKLRGSGNKWGHGKM